MGERKGRGIGRNSNRTRIVCFGDSRSEGREQQQGKYICEEGEQKGEKDPSVGAEEDVCLRGKSSKKKDVQETDKCLTGEQKQHGKKLKRSITSKES